MILIRDRAGRAVGQRRDVLEATEQMKRLGYDATCWAPGGVLLARCVPFSLAYAMRQVRSVKPVAEEEEL